MCSLMMLIVSITRAATCASLCTTRVRVLEALPEVGFIERKCRHVLILCLVFIFYAETITVINKWSHAVQSNKYGSLGEVTNFVTQDISDFAIGDKLKSSVVLMLNVGLTSASYYPTRFEYCNTNNDDGIVVNLPVPAGGWKVGSNQVYVSESSFAYSGKRDWSHRTRLELYINAQNAAKPTDTITVGTVARSCLWLSSRCGLVMPNRCPSRTQFSDVRFVDTNADWCTFVTGDGTGASGTEQKLPNKVASRQECALQVRLLHPKANGATYGDGGKCYAEFGWAKSNGNPKWQTCKFQGY